MNESSLPSSEKIPKTQNMRQEIASHPDAEARRKMLLASLQNTSKQKEEQGGDDKKVLESLDDWTIIHNY